MKSDVTPASGADARKRSRSLPKVSPALPAESRPASRLLEIADVIVESEGTVANSSSGYRTLFKANAICSTGSEMLFVVAAEVR